MLVAGDVIGDENGIQETLLERDTSQGQHAPRGIEREYILEIVLAMP